MPNNGIAKLFERRKGENKPGEGGGWWAIYQPPGRPVSLTGVVDGTEYTCTLFGSGRSSTRVEAAEFLASKGHVFPHDGGFEIVEKIRGKGNKDWFDLVGMSVGYVIAMGINNEQPIVMVKGIYVNTNPPARLPVPGNDFDFIFPGLPDAALLLLVTQK